MKLKFIVFFTLILSVTLYGNWTIYDNNPSGASVNEADDGVVTFIGNGTKNGYKYSFGEDNNKNLKWDMKFSENYVIYAKVDTDDGYRYLYYTKNNSDRDQRGNYIHHGLGISTKDGTWHIITRDLEKDLQDAEPNNSIKAVISFLVRGSGEIKNLELFTPQNETPPTEYEYTMYEDAQNGDTVGWSIYDNKPAGAKITNIFDEERNSYVISLNGSSTRNGYRLGNSEGRAGAWNNRDQFNLSWRMKFEDRYTIYVRVLTKNAVNGKFWRYFYYTNLDYDRGVYKRNKNYIHFGLGRNTADSWNPEGEAIVRDLDADLKSFESNNSIVAVNAFLVRGSGLLDDIFLFSKDEENFMDMDIAISDAESIQEGNSGVSTMNFNITLSAPAPKDLKIGYSFGGSADANDYNNSTTFLSIATGASSAVLEVPVYGDTNVEGNESIEITIAPEDDIFNEIEAVATGIIINDDQEEVLESNGTIYSDGTTLEGWRVFDNKTGQTQERHEANITIAKEGDNSVIKLSGQGRDSGYILGGFYKNRDDAWNNEDEFVVNWKMKYSENYTIYIRLELEDGQYKYLVYQPRDKDLGFRSGHVYIGLGANSKDGSWQTFTRDVKADFAKYSDANISAIHGFLVRGSGFIDDVFLSSKDEENPEEPVGTETLYEDGTGLKNWRNSGGSKNIQSIDGDRDAKIFLKDKGRFENENWNNSTEFIASWDMKASQHAEMFFLVETENHGDIFVTYTSKDIRQVDNGNDSWWNSSTGWWSDEEGEQRSWGRYAYIKRATLNDGKWHSYEENLIDGLHTLFPNEIIVRVKAGRIEAFASDTNLYVDNIKLKSE